MSEIFQSPNDSKEHKFVQTTTFPVQSKAEVEFVVNDVNAKHGNDSPDRDSSESERFSRSPSFQLLSDVEDKDSDQELGEDYCSPHLYEKPDISSPKADSPKEIETPQNDVGQSKLPLPPRLREATYRNPLLLSPKSSLIRKDSTELPKPSCMVQLFSPKRSPQRNSVQSPGSPLSRMLKKQKGVWVKLSRSSLDLIRKSIRKLKVLRHPPPAVHGNQDGREDYS